MKTSSFQIYVVASRPYLQRWTTALTRPQHHPGNHKYCWVLHRRDRTGLPIGWPYPKRRAIG